MVCMSFCLSFAKGWLLSHCSPRPLCLWWRTKADRQERLQEWEQNEPPWCCHNLQRLHLVTSWATGDLWWAQRWGFFDWMELCATAALISGSKYSLKLLEACIQMWWSFVPPLWWLSQNQRGCLSWLVRCDGGPALAVSLACVTDTGPCSLHTNCTEEVSVSSSSWTSLHLSFRVTLLIYEYSEEQWSLHRRIWAIRM